MQRERIKAIRFDWKSFLEAPNFLSNSFRLLLLIAFPIIVYFQDFIQLFYLALADPEIQYVLLVPFVAAFFFYKKRKAFLVSRKNLFFQDVIGICLCLLAIAIYVWGSYSLYSLQIHLLSLPVFVAGIVLLVFSAAVLRILIFPIALLAFLSPFPLIFLDSYGGTLIESVATPVAFILKPFLPIELSYKPITVLSTFTTAGEKIQFYLGAPCSGIYSLTAFLFFAVVFTYLATGSPIKKVLFGGLSLFAAYILNVFRVLTMVVLGHFFGYGLAVDVFHIFGGVALIFIGTLILLYLGDKLLKFSFLQKKTRDTCPFCKEAESICGNCGRILKLPKIDIKWKRLALILVFFMLCATLILQASAINYNAVIHEEKPAMDFNTNTGEIAALSNLPNWSISFLSREPEAERVLNLMFVGDYLLTKKDKSSTAVAIFEFSDIQSKFHTWEGCLNYQSFEINIEKTFYSTLYEESNNIVVGETLITSAPTLNQKIIILSWFGTLNLRVDGTKTLWSVKVSLLKYIDNTNNQTRTDQVEAATTELLSLGNEIEKTWSQYKNFPTGFVVDIYKNKEAFVTVLTALLILSATALSVRHLLEKAKAQRKIAELSDADKILLKKLKHRTSMTPNRYKRRNRGYPLNKIEEFCQQGILREKISLKNDELYLEWISY